MCIKATGETRADNQWLTREWSALAYSEVVYYPFDGYIQFEAARLEDRARNAAGIVRGSDTDSTPLPGNLLLCEEGTGVHLGDAVFMDAWSKHPLFTIY